MKPKKTGCLKVSALNIFLKGSTLGAIGPPKETHSIEWVINSDYLADSFFVNFFFPA